MSASTAAARARAFAATLFESTCTIRAVSTGRTTDSTTGAVTPTPGVVVYSGRCRVRPSGTQGATVNVGGAESFTFDYLVSIPTSVAAVIEGQRVRVDSSPDAALVGIEVQVEKVERGDHITARRLSCSEVS